jgi:hypothetical protein
MTRLNKISNRAMRVGGPSPRRRWDIAKWFAFSVANRRWIAEMRCKYGVSLLDEEDFDNAGLTTADDLRRAHEIEVEEIAAVAHLDPNGPWYAPNAGSWDCLAGGPDEASGMLISDLLGLDDRSIATDLDRIETELEALREELDDRVTSEADVIHDQNR